MPRGNIGQDALRKLIQGRLRVFPSGVYEMSPDGQHVVSFTPNRHVSALRRLGKFIFTNPIVLGAITGLSFTPFASRLGLGVVSRTAIKVAVGYAAAASPPDSVLRNFSYGFFIPDAASAIGRLFDGKLIGFGAITSLGQDVGVNFKF